MSLGPCQGTHCLQQAASAPTGAHLQQHLLAQWPGRARCICILFSALPPAARCAWGWPRLPPASASHLPLFEICCLLFSEGVMFLQTLAEVHGHLCTHDDIKLENIHVAVKQRSADTAVTVLDFGISGCHPNGGSPS